MKVAVTSQGRHTSSQIDLFFGRAAYLVIVDTDVDGFSVFDNTASIHAEEDAGIRTAMTIVDVGADAVITGNVGPKAFAAMKAANIKVFLGASGTVREALDALKDEGFQPADTANVKGQCA